MLDALDIGPWQALIEREGGTDTFARGLYGCSEMFVNGLLALADAGLLRRPADEQGAAVLHGGFFLGPGRSTSACATCRWNSAHGLP